ncbi:FKBP-type peptidyl-prolyl cis-trans isomerase [Streptomyces sp. AJS327]|uniref:FKBP-type peptidyl-prolyl cis-trans isomerase n=1 Tax=Streptomyces sp. AJS327 TaxID=2545265 RepID=UPI0015DFFDB8|nr:FKBP-type peptidyl-prolyl cis-trans isomerase [Streptomyces sp. AJS327]MBA0050698.1 FKBP-type peptidyl-prolyl cis-trans isomerase [Streptomyces sp. AJS327]
MMSKKFARRCAVALTVPALLVTAACGSEDDKEDSVKVSGKAGEQPKVSVGKDAKPPKKTVAKTLSAATGKEAKVAKGDFVRLDIVAKTVGGQSSQDLINTWKPDPGAKKGAARTQMVEQIGRESQLPGAVTKELVGKKPGSRVQVEGTAQTLFGPQAAQMGMDPKQGMVWVMDIVSSTRTDKDASAKGDQESVEDGMPEVEVREKKPASFTIPKGEKPPKKLRSQKLIKGDGPEVKPGEGLVAQYTGVAWEDGEVFDSTKPQEKKKGEKEQPQNKDGVTAFQVGTKSVISGWDKALAGSKVGDRVLLVVPPKEGYGSPEALKQAQQSGQQHPLAKKNLVFVVDVVDKV